MPWLIFAIFVPAGVGLATQIVMATALSHQVLALGILLMSIEQARMAVVDLANIAVVQQTTEDQRLERFRSVAIATILLELIGFYMAVRWLGYGSLIVLASQLFFNTVAQIELQPHSDPAIAPCIWSDRKDVLIADILGLLLVSLWISNIGAIWMAAALLTIVIVYIGLKYLPLCLQKLKSTLTSP